MSIKLILFLISFFPKLQWGVEFISTNKNDNFKNIIESSIIVKNKIFLQNTIIDQQKKTKESSLNVKNDDIKIDSKHYWDGNDFNIEFNFYNDDLILFINSLASIPSVILQVPINLFINCIKFINHSHSVKIHKIKNHLIIINKNSILGRLLNALNLRISDSFFWEDGSFNYEIVVYIKKIIFVNNIPVMKNSVLDLIVNPLDYINIFFMTMIIISFIINLLIYFKIISFNKNTIIKSLITSGSALIYYGLNKNIRYNSNYKLKSWNSFV